MARVYFSISSRLSARTTEAARTPAPVDAFRKRARHGEELRAPPNVKVSSGLRRDHGTATLPPEDARPRIPREGRLRALRHPVRHLRPARSEERRVGKREHYG